jgi:hypothetical protein
VDTGQNSNIGMRLRAVEKHLQGENVFLANYADGLTDLPLPEITSFFEKSGKIACFVGVKPASSFHLVKGIGWFALFALPGAWILMRLTRGRGGMGEPAAVPLALLVVAVLQLVAAPAQNAISRRMEAESDWKALQSTRDPASARALFVSFAETGLGDPDPPEWSELMLGTHPTLADRVAMANAWAKRTIPAK